MDYDVFYKMLTLSKNNDKSNDNDFTKKLHTFYYILFILYCRT